MCLSQGRCTVTNKLGLHARATTRLVSLIKKFNLVGIWICRCLSIENNQAINWSALNETLEGSLLTDKEKLSIVSQKLHEASEEHTHIEGNYYCYVDAKSIMSIMMLAISNEEVEVVAIGKDANHAVNALISLIEDKFNEDE